MRTEKLSPSPPSVQPLPWRTLRPCSSERARVRALFRHPRNAQNKPTAPHSHRAGAKRNQIFPKPVHRCDEMRQNATSTQNAIFHLPILTPHASVRPRRTTPVLAFCRSPFDLHFPCSPSHSAVSCAVHASSGLRGLCPAIQALFPAHHSTSALTLVSVPL
jgi:hypothetical protein